MAHSRTPSHANGSKPAAEGPAGDLYDWRSFDPRTLPGGMSAPLAAELVTYRDRLDEMLKDHAGQFVVIKGDRIVAYHSSRQAALKAVLREFGREPALIKQVLDKEPVRRRPRENTEPIRDDDLGLDPVFALAILPIRPFRHVKRNRQ
jgi:hypothetical protein